MIMSSSEKVAKEKIQPLWWEPPNVRGALELDREAFRYNVCLPGLLVPCKVMSKYRKQLARLRPQPVLPGLSDNLPSDHVKAMSHRWVACCPQRLANARLGKLFNQEELDLLVEGGVDLLQSVEDRVLHLSYDDMPLAFVTRCLLPVQAPPISGFSRIGHIAHLNLRPEHLAQRFILGQVLLDKLKHVRSVVNKTQQIDHQFRFFGMELLAGEPDYVTDVSEQGCRFRLDYSKVYWNSRLSTEHSRLVESLAPDNVLYDVFAGVGPFAIPAARRGVRVLANDLNPESFRWLSENVRLNLRKAMQNRDDLIRLDQLDGMDFIRGPLAEDLRRSANAHFDPSIVKHHVVMNLPGLAPQFLPAFRGILPPSLSCVRVRVWCYCFVRPADEDENSLRIRLTRLLELSDVDVLDEWRLRVVRDVSPSKDMCCAHFLLDHRVLCASHEISDGDEAAASKRMKLEDESPA